MAEQEITPEARQRKTYRKWYESKGAGYNDKRKERYANDPEYRDRIKAQARETRERRKARGGVQETSVIRDGVEVYRVSAAAELLGKSPDALRSWMRKGWVPENTEQVHRCYRKPQIKLMQRLVDCIEKYRYAKNYEDRLQKVVDTVHANW